MKWLLGFLGLALLLFVSFLLARALLLTSKQSPPVQAVDIQYDRVQAVSRLAEAVQFQTISNSDAAMNQESEFSGFIEYLETAFPRLHSALTREVVGGYSLLYTWPGQDLTLKPILLMAHYDVVPVEPGTEAAWDHPAFAGQVSSGYIYGRGTLDDKTSMIATLEAVEILLEQGYQPQRTILLSFGHDEEVGGLEGARRIAELLSGRGIELEYVLDEGLSITEGIVPNVTQPAALVGIAHKGYVSIELTAASTGGHSSMPPRETAIGIVAAAIQKLEENPLPARLEGPGLLMLETLAPHMPFTMRLVFANTWLFGGLIESQMAATPSGNAALRTTTAATMFQAGVKENVLPSQARAVVNFRIIPGDTAGDVAEYVRKTINDPRVQVQPIEGMTSEPSPVSDTQSMGYRAIEDSIRSVYPEVLVSPGLMVAAGDIIHFTGLSQNLYRFAPLWLRPDDLDRLHGLNERISVDDYDRAVQFYYVLLKNSAAAGSQTQ